MENENFEIPEYLKALFDTELLKELASEPFFPIHELSLFKWHVEETEALHKRMRAGELAYINKQLSANQEDINDSGIPRQQGLECVQVVALHNQVAALNISAREF